MISNILRPGRRLKAITFFDVALATILVFVIYLTLYPFLIVVFTSISDPVEIMKHPLILYPRTLWLDTYRVVLFKSSIMNGFKNSLIYAVTYTVLSVLITMAAAYALSVKSFKARKFLMPFFLVTMFFSGGLIPSYILITSLGMFNTMWAFIIPGLVSTFNLILVRTFIEQLPGELIESSVIDGANEVQVLLKIIIPLSMPIMATIGLWAMVGQWNSYFGPVLYLTDSHKYPLQIIMQQLLATSAIDELSLRGQMNVADIASMRQRLQSDSLKSAVIVISALPILVAYPWVQKYFVKGIMIGSIKG